MPITEERNPRRRVHGRYNNELLKRIYNKEEIGEDGTVVYARIQNGQLIVHEYPVERVGEKAIRFKEKGLLGKQIPITSIGFVNNPKRRDLEIMVDGSAISSDFNLLVNTMLEELEKFISEQKRIFIKQHSSAKEAYLCWGLDCESGDEEENE
ncbi:hypothetical protein [Bacillus thuringiensis]|uniref:hypothetical protein n=1 Tax=Bacillus thuringiensis TaxID=1428 RepID=UPI0035DC4398